MLVGEATLAAGAQGRPRASASARPRHCAPSLVAADGAKVAAEGALVAADGAKVAADGAKVAADGAKVAAEGGTLLLQGLGQA